MAEDDHKESKNDSLWMFRREQPSAPAGRGDFDPARAVYQLHRNTRNPYLKRALAPSVPRLERSGTDLARLFRMFSAQRAYEVSPTNTGPAFRRRSLHHPPPPATAAPRYQEPVRLPGNLNRLPWLVEEFFQSVLERLREAPEEFAIVVEDLMHLFKEHQVRIKLYNAYYTLADWDDLLATLEEISQYPAPETFDLFCSALFAYYDLVYPPDEA